MHILRLATSDDVRPTVAESERGYRLVESALAAETGEAVETVAREIWPNEELADVIGGWMERFQPDVVSLKVSSFWFSYPSVPLKVRRGRLRRIGKSVGRAGYRTASASRLAGTPAFHAARNLIRRAVGGAVYFTPEQVIDRISTAIHRVLQREGVLLVVRGPLVAEAGGCSADIQRRFELERRHVDGALADLCRELHVHYTGCRAAPPVSELLCYRAPDRLHQNAAGQRRVGLEEAEAMVLAWRHAQGAEVPLYLESRAVT